MPRRRAGTRIVIAIDADGITTEASARRVAEERLRSIRPR
jgi:hypothetical protein